MITKFDITYVLKVVLKSFICSILLIVGMIVGGMVAIIFGLTQPIMPASIDTNLTIILMIPAGMIISIVLGELFKKLNQGFLERFVCIFLFNYIIYYLLQVFESVIFTTMMNLSFGIVSDIFPSLFISLAIAKMWKPIREDRSLRTEAPGYFARRKTPDWTWRLVLAWLAYVPIYYFVGVAISPWVLPYYNDPSLELGIILPDMSVMIALQFIRSAFFLFAAMLVIIMWKGNKQSLRLGLGLSIFVQVAMIPLIVGYWLPIGLRIPHAFELTVDSFAQAIIYVGFLFNELPSPIYTNDGSD
jgi:hypothetical protein